MQNQKTLQELGLSEYEAKIYLTLLHQGPLSAYALAQKAGLYRQVTYDALARLEQKGAVSSVKESKTTIYKASDPKLILDIMQEKVDSFKQTIPNLSKLYNQTTPQITVETYQGENVLRIALRDIINQLKNESDKENCCTAVDEHPSYESHKTILEQYQRDMLRFKVKERVLIKENTKGIFTKKTSTYRHIKEKYFNPNPTQIYGDNVSILTWGNPSHLIIIRSKQVAQSYKKQFELLWKAAQFKKY